MMRIHQIDNRIDNNTDYIYVLNRQHTIQTQIKDFKANSLQFIKFIFINITVKVYIALTFLLEFPCWSLDECL